MGLTRQADPANTTSLVIRIKEIDLSEDDGKLFYVQGNQHSESFDTSEEVVSFLNNEMTYWQWIRNTLGQAGGIIYQTYVHAPINTIRSQNLINPRINLSSFLLSTSPPGIFLEGIRKTHGDAVALIAFIYFHPEKTSITKTSRITQTLSSPDNLYEVNLAIYNVAKYKGDLSATSDIAETSIRDTITRVAVHASEAKEEILNITCAHQEELENFRTKLKSQISSWNKQFKKRSRSYRKIATSVKVNANSQLKSAMDDIVAAKEAYHDTIDFKASVAYWTQRKSSHLIGKYGWLAALTTIMILTAVGLSLYYSHGGIIGIFGQPNLADPQATELSLDQSDKKIFNLAGAGLIITFFWILLRIALKQFNIHANLAIEASERVTMTKTYLALLSEGKLNADQDRKLVLEALFRSSQLASTASDSASTPVELIIKAITEKRPQ